MTTLTRIFRQVIPFDDAMNRVPSYNAGEADLLVKCVSFVSRCVPLDKKRVTAVYTDALDVALSVIDWKVVVTVKEAGQYVTNA